MNGHSFQKTPFQGKDLLGASALICITQEWHMGYHESNFTTARPASRMTLGIISLTWNKNYSGNKRKFMNVFAHVIVSQAMWSRHVRLMLTRLHVSKLAS